MIRHTASNGCAVIAQLISPLVRQAEAAITVVRGVDMRGRHGALLGPGSFRAVLALGEDVRCGERHHGWRRQRNVGGRLSEVVHDGGIQRHGHAICRIEVEVEAILE